MSTKQVLLRESEWMLQHNLQNALREDPQQKKAYTPTLNQHKLVPIIPPSSYSSTDSIQLTEPKIEFHLGHCHGWIRRGRVWIRVQCSNNSIHLFPFDLLPETVHTAQTDSHFFFGFDLLPDISEQDIQHLGVYAGSKLHPIEWLDHQDTSWIAPLSICVMQVYFPCHVRVDNVEWNDHAEVGFVLFGMAYDSHSSLLVSIGM
ncbi:uncharacterized protein B0P05DRAFT_583742 [Gilbertella persicaria]|uniref:uncharacterized protein n=1 Tax=Gilbertella persicaria TaxID=101096 RepID=UPI002220585C|nr:uncharacterized protein B0P05DRAFT_583742 [Gilbertella persicaria]KAI8091218.1 hypothetical protein B0P05DRAFT_583742 [Gilbertella persicaria]